MKTTTKTGFKRTEMGMIPEEWSILTIGEVAKVIGGGTPSTEDVRNFGGDIPWVTPKDLSNYPFRYIRRGERNITKRGLENSSAKLLPRGTVLLTTRAPVGYVAIAENEVSTNQGFRSLVPKNNASSEFLYYLLKLNTEHLKSHASGTTFGELSGSTLKSLKFPFPPSREQKSIVSILGTLDDKIELNQQMNKTLEEIGKAIFKHWFVDFEFPNEEGKPYKSSRGEMVYNEELEDEIPKGWAVKPFSEVIAVNPPRELERGQKGKKVGMADLGPWEANIKNWGYEEYKSGPRFRNGDTLFARITPSLEHGKTALVSILGESEVGFGSTEFIVFGKKLISSELYIFHLSRSERIRSVAIGAMSGTSGRQRVPDRLFDYLRVVVPPSPLIDSFDAMVSPLFNRVSLNAKEVKTRSQIRDLLLPKLMSGKIRVPVEAR
jgi:type I restriction enzyme S subunit